MYHKRIVFAHCGHGAWSAAIVVPPAVVSFCDCEIKLRHPRHTVRVERECARCEKTSRRIRRTLAKLREEIEKTREMVVEVSEGKERREDEDEDEGGEQDKLLDPR
jgi:hypothetical protein